MEEGPRGFQGVRSARSESIERNRIEECMVDRNRLSRAVAAVVAVVVVVVSGVVRVAGSSRTCAGMQRADSSYLRRGLAMRQPHRGGNTKEGASVRL